MTERKRRLGRFRRWWRSAITGRFITRQEAADSPDTTVQETRRDDKGGK